MSQINLLNTQFANFVKFASEQANAAKSKTVVTADAAGTGGVNALAGRRITANDADHVGKFRNASLKAVNNEVRELFKSSISEMFGGVDKIPASVKSAMKFGDFGKGKPLTVRRDGLSRRASYYA